MVGRYEKRAGIVNLGAYRFQIPGLKIRHLASSDAQWRENWELVDALIQMR